ncbi:membrane-binding protein [Leptospira barantonii]|uniref:Membrane-binding protein n=1 Tax=Leptospira barantonii TaxID=2023184 RepID=A0A5F2BNV8_9LEPT|nr:membrane-binding protein [Leptospira barantonii]TGM07192.1 membrane-binding protein [Leptospira barantonii]
MGHKILESLRKIYFGLINSIIKAYNAVKTFAKTRRILFIVSSSVLFTVILLPTLFFTLRKSKCIYGNCKYGFGAKEFRDGTRYAGEFYNGFYNGTGTIRNPEGHSYEGAWILGKKHGKGRYLYPDGSSYEGEFVEDIKQGLGLFTWPDNTKLSAVFVNGEPEGKGILRLSNGIEFIGEYKKGVVYQGKGIYIYDDGSKYMGEWLNGKRHGKGTLFGEAGNIIFIGEWENDQQKKAMSLNNPPSKK